MENEVHSGREMLDAPAEALVCYCAGLSKGRVLAARQAGARTLADIKAMTGACATVRCQEMSPRRR